MKEKALQYKKSSVFYRLTGKGKPVILIHGFGEDGDIWQKQVEKLQQHFRLIIPDLPGSGKSGFLPDAGIETYSEVVKAILLEEQIDRCCMLGHSMGGYITLAFAEKYPQMLSSFGLVHSSAFADSEEKKMARLKSIEFIKTHGAHDFLQTAIPGLFGKEWSVNHQAEIGSLVEKGRGFSSEALIQYYRAMIARPDRTHVLKNFPGPVLYIIGQYDNAVPFTQSMQQCYLPNQSHVHVLRHSAHMGMWEETARVNNVLLGFLE